MKKKSLIKTLAYIKHRIKYKVLNIYCSLYHMNREILLESYPDMSCNTYELYRYFLKIGLNKKICITWMVNNPDEYSNVKEENVSFIKINPVTRKSKLAFYVRRNRALVTITCNRYIAKYMVSNKQINIYIQHGSPMKDCQDNYYLFFKCGYLISQSSFFIPFTAKIQGIKEQQILPLGFPRNDQLFRPQENLKKIYSDIVSFDKVIIWVPTFRSQENSNRVDSDFVFPLGIPVLYDEISVKTINQSLAKMNILLIIKPHPAQRLDAIRIFNLSNIRILTIHILQENNVQTNELLAQTDAMITDYSGIYYDYLLLDKPIGITIDDYSEYRKKKGFVFDEPFDVLKGEYIHDIDELEEFIINVKNGNDVTYKDRLRIKTVTNTMPFEQSSERLCSFLIDKLKGMGIDVI